MKICLVNANYYNPYVSRYCPPIGLLIIAAVLEQNNYEVEFIDLPWLVNQGQLKIDAAYPEKAAELISDGKPEVIGLSGLCHAYPHVIQIAQRCKLLNPQVKIILGGAQATTTDVETIQNFPFIDFVVRGEGELTLVELLNKLGNQGDFSGVNGITYRTSEHRVTQTPRRELIKDLDSLPLPAYHLIDEIIRQSHPPFWQVSIGRGCPHRCAFCAAPQIWERHYRLRSPESIIKEILLLKESYGFRNFYFIHEDPLANKTKFKEFCQVLIQSKLDIQWSCNARIDHVTPELLDLMKQAGCKTVIVGLESGSPRILRIIQKDLDLSKVLINLKECEKRGIQVLSNFIVGFPEETSADLNATCQLALQCAASGNQIWLRAVSPLAGTTLFERHKDRLMWTNLFTELLESVVRWEKEDSQTATLIKRYPFIFSSFYGLRPMHFPPELPYELQNVLWPILRHYPKFYDTVSKRLKLSPLELFQKFKAWVKKREPEKFERWVRRESIEPFGIGWLDEIMRYLFAFFTPHIPQFHPKAGRRERVRLQKERESERTVSRYVPFSIGLTPYENKALQPRIKSVIQLLDISLGVGRTAIPLIKRGYKVVALEFSVAVAKKVCTTAVQHHVKLPLVVGEPDRLPFKPTSFDLVFMPDASVQHIPGRFNRIAALKQVHHVLTPHGTVLMHFRTPGFNFRPIAGYIGSHWLRKIIIGVVYLSFITITSITNLQRKLRQGILERFYQGLEPWDQVYPSGELVFFHWYHATEAMEDLLFAGFGEIGWFPASSEDTRRWPQPSQDFFAKGTKTAVCKS